MKEELISIIIPVYNAEKYILETIHTIKNQTYKNWEAIFVDDCSEDRSKKIIEEQLSTRIKLLTLKKHSGTAIARNEGIKIANGKYLAFLDADDLWDNKKLEKQIQYMKENDYGFTYTAFKYVNENNTKQSRKINVQLKLDYKNALKNTRILPTAVIMNLDKIPKEDCYMVNVMNEDIATWWKLLKKGNIAYGLNEPLVFYRRYKNSKTSSKLKNATHRWEIYRKVEKLSLPKSVYYFIHYIFYGIVKRLTI